MASNALLQILRQSRKSPRIRVIVQLQTEHPLSLPRATSRCSEESRKRLKAVTNQKAMESHGDVTSAFGMFFLVGEVCTGLHLLRFTLGPSACRLSSSACSCLFLSRSSAFRALPFVSYGSSRRAVRTSCVPSANARTLCRNKRSK